MDKYLNADLTKKEQDVMQTLWDTASHLSSLEICNHAASIGINLNQSTVHVIVNKLMQRGFISVAEIMQINRATVRFFRPEITRDEYVVMKLRQVLSHDYVDKAKKHSYLSAALTSEEVAKDLAGTENKELIWI
jgi:predicted transcriptional regulator